MIRADARQNEQKMFDYAIKLKSLAFDDLTYEQAIKIRQECEELYKKQQFYKHLIKHSDNINKEEIENERHFTR